MSSLGGDVTRSLEPWNDPERAADERVAALIAAMTLREKVAQLYGTWIDATTEDGHGVAPHQDDMDAAVDLDAVLPFGLGQLTRPFGTKPVDAGVGAAQLAALQRRVVAANRFGIPALVHEECLTGFTTWGATAYPTPLAWGASFDPELIRAMATRIGAGMHSVGVHQGLAPVLDVTRDSRWGRTEETIGEDPYLVGTIATAYVRGLEGAGVVATLKHFAGYSASKAARNLAPVTIGPRELADVILPPFEMAVRESGVRSVMHSYAAIDGVPAAANAQLLTTILRDGWGFDGTVVADYFGIGFLKLLHGVADTWGDAAALALRAGVDVELPTINAYADPLVGEVESGRLDERFVDRALERVLRQKLELGLLDPDWNPLPAGYDDADLVEPERARGRIELDDAEGRELARRIAEESVVLLSDDGVLPLAVPASIAVIGPVADDPMTMLGCYAFPNHVLDRFPELGTGIAIPTIAQALRAEFPGSACTVTTGVPVDAPDRSGIPAAVAAAREAELAVVVLGDRSGLFGRGTSGEGCDAESLRLPGAQQELLDAVLETGTPVVLVVVSGRPYALGSAVGSAGAIVQAFFPGEEGGAAIAGVLSGRVNPSGRLPVSVPVHPGAQPSSYLAPQLARRSEVSNIDPSPAFGFGHGLAYTSFAWEDLEVLAAGELDTNGEIQAAFTVRNTGNRAGTEVVQAYLHDPVASTVQPEIRLVGYLRVELEPGESARVDVTAPVELSAFTGVDGRRIVEPGALELRLARSSDASVFSVRAIVTGETREVDHTRRLHAELTADHG
ncbi:MAG TPA: glycoside hydrolase family 3 N-terminal domain-containing protein [Gryllotalpicola sp.]